jgi:hypothetical protein
MLRLRDVSVGKRRERWLCEEEEDLERHLRKRMTLEDVEMREEEGGAPSGLHRRDREEEYESEEERSNKHKQSKVMADLDMQTGETSDLTSYFLYNGRKKYLRRVDYLVDKLIERAALRRRTGEIMCSANQCGENGLATYIPRGSHPLQDHLLSLSPPLRRDRPRLLASQKSPVEAPVRGDEQRGEEGDMGAGITHTEWGMQHIVDRINEGSDSGGMAVDSPR